MIVQLPISLGGRLSQTFLQHFAALYLLKQRNTQEEDATCQRFALKIGAEEIVSHLVEEFCHQKDLVLVEFKVMVNGHCEYII